MKVGERVRFYDSRQTRCTHGGVWRPATIKGFTKQRIIIEIDHGDRKETIRAAQYNVEKDCAQG